MNIRVALFLSVGLVQLAVPGWMIFEQEQTLRLGTEFKFQTEPVDPYDIFRGRYVMFRFTAEEVHQKASETEFPRDTKVYVTVKTNEAGFAEVERVSRTPLEGENVFQATVLNVYDRRLLPGPSESDIKDKPNTLALEFPFRRYYMEETHAPAAEQAYRKANLRNSKQQTWAVVRLRHGNAALADLIIDGQPIRDYLRDHPQPKK